MTKRIFYAILLGALLLATGYAQQAANGSGPQLVLISANVDNESGAITTTTNQLRVGNVVVDTTTETGQALLQIQERERVRVNQTLNGTGQQVQNTHSYMVQNQVHSLVETAELVEGPMGLQVRTIARNMNESTQLMVQAEEQVQARSGFVRFLFGSDQTAVNEMELQMNRTRERIQDMEQMLSSVNDEAVRAMIQEQIQNMETQLTQVQAKVQSEKQIKGLLSFIFRNRKSE